jgi:NADH:ubiquinone oxidoreductase subunit 2 (subunit N)
VKDEAHGYPGSPLLGISPGGNNAAMPLIVTVMILAGFGFKMAAVP